MIALTSPVQIERYRLTVVRSAIRLYLDHGIKANRMYTPANLKHVVSGYTGKTYGRSRKGLEAAYADLNALLA